MNDTILQLLADLHINNHRQGPGSDEAFMRALALSGIDTETTIEIADIGCGTGSATIPLLQHTQANITAVELLPAFLNKLQANAEEAGVTDRLTTVEADMGDLPFSDEQFDALWSEGAIYNIGFETGVKNWQRFLKPGGVLVASEITWIRADVPDELQKHWDQEYPEVATASNKIAVLENNGYSPIGYFSLTPDCWIENYYEPLQKNLPAFLERNGRSEEAMEIAETDTHEYELYKKYQDYFSYGVYIARKV
jgi:ubiquinone/menaquinone biosynthesis C-methylase UbiE